MKGLSHRLSRTLSTTPESPAVSELRTHDLADSSVATSRHGLEMCAPGRIISNEDGSYWLIQSQYALNHLHGARELGGLFLRDLDRLALVTGDARLHSPAVQQMLFLDIEATGLSQGAGTHAFLIGLAYFEDEALIVEQLLMREPREEGAVLRRVMALLERFPLLVSFNGKSYDTSVLRNRLVIHRYGDDGSMAIKLSPHFDLLHLSRNLYKGCWVNTRLGTLEAERLGVIRKDDMPGHLVPSTWFHFLRTGDARPLRDAIEHNRIDVLSMVTLADALMEDCASEVRDELKPKLRLNLGKLLFKRGAFTEALRVLGPLRPDDLSVDDWVQCNTVLSHLGRRLDLLDVELEALHEMMTLRPEDDGIAARLSVAYERRGRDLRAAIRFARLSSTLSPTSPNLKRERRLELRLNVTEAAG